MASYALKINMRRTACFVCALVIGLVNARTGSSQPIDTAMAISIGGIQQWLSIKGADRGNPVLLFLHGGPGNSVISYSDKFSTALQQHFVFVNWDQRESGKTATINASPKPLTVALMTSDAIEVVNFLRGEFAAEKIYLAGHSWGGFLGMKVANEHPELLKAFIAVCPMIYQAESERLALRWMLDKANAEGNSGARNELAKVSIPFGSGEQLYYSRKWLLHYAGAKEPDRKTVITWAQKWLTLFNEASAVNFMIDAPRIGCPVYFFVGGRDYQTSTKLTTDYYHAVGAPDKLIFVFEKTAHNLPSAEPGRFQQTIIEKILPRTAK